MNPKKSDILFKIILETLREKSRKGLEHARKTMLTEKIESHVIRTALEYYVTNWGILTHPAPFLIAYEAVGGNPNEAVETQAAVVMLSAALDIHDDIIDKSIVKHGKPTVVGKFGQDIALLLGDAFFVKGFTLLGVCAAKLAEGKRNEVLQIVKKAMYEVGDAHALEFDFRGKINADPEGYMKILKMKAVTTEVSMQLGAIFGGGTNREIKILTKYGRILGTLAALREEFIDMFESQELNQRIQNECLPLPILYALQGESSEEIRKILSKKRITDDDIYELLELVLGSEQIKMLKKKMAYLIKCSNELISEVKDRKSKSLLVQLTKSMIEDL